MARGITIVAAAATAVLVAGSPPASAQSAAEYSAWLNWCRQQGGIPNGDPNTPVCAPGDQSGGSSGLSASQQSMLGLAGAIGSALGNAIRESMEAAARQEAMRQMQQSWELERARLFAVEERARLTQEIKAKNEALMARLKGSVQLSELSLVRVERRELQLRNHNEMFGVANDRTASTTQEVVVAGAIAAPTPPSDVEGRPLDPSRTEEARRSWDAYLAALQRNNQVRAEVALAKHRHEAAQLIVIEARKNAEMVKLRASSAPPSSSARDDKLAEAERLLAQATDLNEKAAKELAKAEAEAEKTQQSLAEAQRHAVQPGSPAAKQPPQ